MNLIKTFFFGILLGLGLAAGALYAFPVVDQHREASIVSVAPNGGNIESFHINIPMDRIMIGASAQEVPLPPGLEWPASEVLQDLRVELFKIRNERDAVIGVAARSAIGDSNSNNVEWVIHFPARGSMFVSLDPTTDGGEARSGEIRSGSRELDSLVGRLSETWVAAEDSGGDSQLGRIELRASYVGVAIAEEPVE